MINYYIQFNAAGEATSAGSLSELGQLPSGAAICTAEQKANYQAYALDTSVSPPEIVSAPASVLLQQAQSAQVSTLRNICQAAIVGGFVSSALGAAHTYPSTLTDQHNLSGSVVASLLPGLPSTWTTPFWCQNSSGAWIFAEHTVAQIQQVGSDGKAWVIAQQTQLQELQAQVMAATTIAAVQAVVWP